MCETKDLLKRLEEKLFDYLYPYKKMYSSELFEFDVSSSEIFEIFGTYKNFYSSEPNECIILRMSINEENKQICISNIFIPEFMTHQGTGKKIISIVFQLAEQFGYELYLIEMVPSFYNKMIKRQALEVEGYSDVLKIVKETKLT